MDQLAKSFAELSTQMAAIADAQRQQTDQMNELKAKVSAHDAQISQALVPGLDTSTAAGSKRPRLALGAGESDDQVGITPGTDLTVTATKQDVVDLVNTAIQSVVVPQFNHELRGLAHITDTRISQLESEIRTLKMRVAWSERDMLSLQTDVAKRQIIMRNWPKDSTEKQRFLTVSALCQKANIWVNTTVLTTPTYEGYEKDADGKWIRNLSPISILTVQSFPDRQALLRVGGKFTHFITDQEVLDGNEEISQQHWHLVKMAPGITQMERRLEAPLQGLMNAYTKAFKAYKGKSFRPMWKSLTVVDDTGAWMGRVNYKRRPHAQSSEAQQVSTAGNWTCEIQIPQELEKQILEAWVEVWSDQRAKQIQLTDAEDDAMQVWSEKQDPTAKHYMQMLTKPRPQYNEGEQLGVEQWKMRFAWEFPWPVSWRSVARDDDIRKGFTEVRTVEDLMKEMSTEALTAEFDAPNAAAGFAAPEASTPAAEGDAAMTPTQGGATPVVAVAASDI